MLKFAIQCIRRGAQSNQPRWCHHHGASSADTFRQAAADNDQAKMEQMIAKCNTPPYVLENYLYSACLYNRIMITNRILQYWVPGGSTSTGDSWPHVAVAIMA